MSLIHGDCIEAMAAMDSDTIDAIVTDPPYGLSFMGKEWDRLTSVPAHSGPQWGGYGWHGSGPTDPMKSQQWHQRWAEAAYRVAKPSAYLLAFGGTRTVHRMTVALEDAGWIIRDMLVWAYASGFPKSKASLKPAWEPIVMARKPGPLRMLAIDECRIPLSEGDVIVGGDKSSNGQGESVPLAAGGYDGTYTVRRGRAGQASSERRYARESGDFAALPGPRGGDALGRWPANVLLTDPIFDGGIAGVVGGGIANVNMPGPHDYNSRQTYGEFKGERGAFGYGDTGTFSRFFLVPKSSRSDREPVITPDGHDATQRFSTHPTVKPTDLMRHLVRLVTPVGGIVLDPFLGSGTTALAAEMEGFEWIGIEREVEYVAIAEARLNGTQRGLGLGA